MTLLRVKLPNLLRDLGALLRRLHGSHRLCSHRMLARIWGGILVALSVSKLLHAFRATNVLLCEVV